MSKRDYKSSNHIVVAGAYSVREDAKANTFSATPIDTARCLQKHQPSVQSHHAQTFIAETASTIQGNGSSLRGQRIDAESAAGGHLIAFSHTQGLDAQPSEEAWPSLRRGGGGQAVMDKHAVVRRLTPLETERLMGWPDQHTAPEGIKAPDSKRYAACGDGIVANVAFWVGNRINQIEQETP